MPRLVSGSGFGGLNTGGAREQLSALFDAMRQLVGDAITAAGSAVFMDPLSAPFHLYVDFDRGSDKFVAGDYNSAEDTEGTEAEQIAQKLKRVRNQRLTCGYTNARPFKTLNRACLEASIITSLAWYTFTDERAHRDCVIIHMGSGPQPIYNHPGNHVDAIVPSAWADGKIPTWQELIGFNDNTKGSVILPRGAAFHGADLRKCVFVPQWAPAAADYASDWSNVRTIISLTPDIHAVDFTFRDPIGQSESLHLLFGIGFPSQAQLTQFYGKVFTALGSSANLSEALTAPRLSEYQVVGPIDNEANEDWDTVRGASAYPERISLRTEFGMGGMFIDGDNLQGLKSVVTAQFTGTCLQTDINSWEVYVGGEWVTPLSYQALIDAEPDSTRMKPGRRSIHMLGINDAFISNVSTFGIGHGVMQFADRGAEITSSNGNFTFGSCAALARGYKRVAFPQDTNWALSRIEVPLSPGERIGNIRTIALGKVEALTSGVITLQVPLEGGLTPGIPGALEAEGYSLKAGTYIWIDNPEGDDWRALLTSSAWDEETPDQISIQAIPTQAGTNAAIPTIDDVSRAIGKRVYVRRVIDTRSPAQRRTSMALNNTSSARTPERGFVVQVSPDVDGGQVDRVFAPDGEDVMIVTLTGKGGTPGAGVTRTAEITIRRGAPSVTYADDTYYLKGTVVKAGNKHWIAKKTLVSEGASPDPLFWGEVYVHMPSDYNPPESFLNEAPELIFDTDTDPNDLTTTCGINWSTVFTDAGPVRDQYRAGVDALGVFTFLKSMGLSATQAWAAIVPRIESERLRDPSSATDFPDLPVGGAASGRGNWAMEFRRPSTISLIGFTWDVGAGRGNYSKALPAAQKTLSPENTFSLYFTSQGGGRVIASGFNENGQTVTPAGLTDNETGELQSFNDIGASDIDAPSVLSNLSVNNLTVSGTLDLSGVNNLTGADAAGGAVSTSRWGFGKLATYEDLTEITQAVTDDEGIDGSADKLITMPALNRVLTDRGFLTAASSTVIIYVDPVNGLGSTTDRVAAIEQFLADPPITVDKAAKSLRYAADYIAAAYTAATLVEYRLLPGIYLDTEVTFKTVTRLRGWKADNSGELYGLRADAGFAFYDNVVDPANRYDPTKHVIFPARLSIGGGVTSAAWNFVSRGCLMRAFETIEINNVVWWDVHQSLLSDLIPSGYHQGFSNNPGLIETWRAGETFDEVYNNVASRACAARPFGATNDLSVGPQMDSLIISSKSLRVINCAVGARVPVKANAPEDVDSPVFQVNGGFDATALYLIGNARLTGNAAPAGGNTFGWKGYPNSGGYEFVGHSSTLIGNGPEQSDLNLQLGSKTLCEYISDVTPSPIVYSGMRNANNLTSFASATRDAPCNNIFFMSHAGGWDRSPSTNWKIQGPYMFSLFNVPRGSVSAARRISDEDISAEVTPWFESLSNTNSGNYAGFKGKLGAGREATSAGALRYTIGLSRNANDLIRLLFSSDVVDIRSTTGTAVTPFRLAGSLVASNRMPAYSIPDGPGLIARTIAVTFTAASATVNATAHPFKVNDVLFFANAGGALPVVLNTTSLFYVTAITANTFTVATTVAGTSLVFATAGTGTHSVKAELYFWDGLDLWTRSYRRGIDGTGTTNLSVGRDYVI